MRNLSTPAAVALTAIACAVPLTVWLVTNGVARSVEATGSAAGNIIDKAGASLERLFGAKETTSFSSYLLSTNGRSGDELLVATRHGMLEAKATSKDYLGGTEVSVSVPYTAQYAIHISTWAFNSAGGTLFIRQPPLLVIDPVSVAVDALTWQDDSALLHFGRGNRLHTEVIAQLQQEANADAVLHRDEVRAEANKAVEAFIRTWLASRDANLREALASRMVIITDLPPCATPPVIISVKPMTH